MKLPSELPVLHYTPFLHGKYSTAPGLKALSKQEGRDPRHRFVFQFDEDFARYRANKEACRKEGIGKYYCESQPEQSTLQAVNAFIAQKLVKEYPDFFQRIRMGNTEQLICRLTNEQLLWPGPEPHKPQPPYRSHFDALCAQLSEDVAVWQLDERTDNLVAVHLCSPNHWAAGEKVGKPFAAVHGPVPGMDVLKKRYRPMLQSIAGKPGTFVRFAWGISTDDRLNHHPEPPQGVLGKDWQGRAFRFESPVLYVRIERQTLTGFPQQQAFLFTIRTYFRAVGSLTADERTALKTALLSMDKAALNYKGLSESLGDILMYLG